MHRIEKISGGVEQQLYRLTSKNVAKNEIGHPNGRENQNIMNRAPPPPLIEST